MSIIKKIAANEPIPNAAVNYVNKHFIKTNVDSLVGQIAKTTTRINNCEGFGAAAAPMANQTVVKLRVRASMAIKTIKATNHIIIITVAFDVSSIIKKIE